MDRRSLTVMLLDDLRMWIDTATKETAVLVPEDPKYERKLARVHQTLQSAIADVKVLQEHAVKSL